MILKKILFGICVRLFGFWSHSQRLRLLLRASAPPASGCAREPGASPAHRAARDRRRQPPRHGSPRNFYFFYINYNFQRQRRPQHQLILPMDLYHLYKNKYYLLFVYIYFSFFFYSIFLISLISLISLIFSIFFFYYIFFFYFSF